MSATVSVVVISRGRRDDLRRCLAALSQQYHPGFETIVVADPQSSRDCEQRPGRRVVSFEHANVAQARNVGVANAGGEVIAFIDDDATAEPTWLDRLTAPLADRSVVAAGGNVIGRNGISLQWGPLSVDALGRKFPIDLAGDETVVLSTERDQRAIMTQGTNMAFRRDVLVALGGFDGAFRYFHDDADINMRVAQSGGLTAVVPAAVVHHRSARSEIRRADRTPLTLFEIGASSAVFLAKHARPRDLALGRENLIEDQRKRLIRMMVDGRLEPRDIELLLRTLTDGFDAGMGRGAGGQFAFGPPPRHVAHHRTTTPNHKLIAGRLSGAGHLRQQAIEAVRSGASSTLILLDATARFHRVRFTGDGVWQHTGGVFGRADRRDPLVRLTSAGDRIALETKRAMRYRSP